MKTELKQDRAIKTREKLITTGFEIMAQKGYHQVTMDEIAKEAGVATGSAYRYFKNKKELFIGILEFYYSNIESFAQVDAFTADKQAAFQDFLPVILDQFYEIHKKYWGFHEELEGMCHTDPDIGNMKKEFLKDAVNGIVSQMPEANRQTPHIKENLYMAIQILEDYSHMMIDMPEEDLDRDYLNETAIRISLGLLGS